MSMIVVNMKLFLKRILFSDSDRYVISRAVRIVDFTLLLFASDVSALPRDSSFGRLTCSSNNF